MTQTIFLSTVTAEFGPIRRRLANLTQRTKKCQARHQDDFFHRGVKTLQKLVEEIQDSDLVVKLIGAHPPHATCRRQVDFDHCVKSVEQKIPAGNPGDVRTWPAWEPLRPHVAFAALEGKRLDIAVPTRRLIGELGVLLSAKAQHREAEILKRHALAIDEQHFGVSSAKLINSRSLRCHLPSFAFETSQKLRENKLTMKAA